MRLQDARFAAVDLETTGLDVRRDHIVAVAAIPMDGTRIRVGELSIPRCDRKNIAWTG